jgi:hypothetical protein
LCSRRRSFQDNIKDISIILFHCPNLYLSNLQSIPKIKTIPGRIL